MKLIDNHDMLLAILKDNKRDHELMRKTLTEIEKDIAKLKVKSSIWGLVGGVIPVSIVMAYAIIRG